MRIVIDMQGAQTESRFRGIGRYTMSFAQAIARNCGDHEIFLVLNGLLVESIESIRASFGGLLPQSAIRVWYAPSPVREVDPNSISNRLVAEIMREAFIQSLQPDLVHICSLFEGFGDDAVLSIGCLDKKTPVSVTVHDLIPLVNSEYYLDKNPQFSTYYRNKLNHLGKADFILSISESSTQEVCKYLNVPKENVVNTSEAADAIFRVVEIDDAHRKELLGRWGINQHFIFYTGGGDERKNLPRLIEAYGKLPIFVRNRHQLVLGGRMPEEIVTSLLEHGLKLGLRTGELIFTGYIKDEELVQFYNLCYLFVFPSWHEGFGLPALEAMASGSPVVGANTSSLPEVIGHADALFDPFDVFAISAKLLQVLSDNDLRLKLKAHGEMQACRFTWDQSARLALSAWERFLGVRDKGQTLNRSTVNPNHFFGYLKPQLLSWSNSAKAELSSDIAYNQQAGLVRQLLLDVSELCQNDAATGVQRVVRSYLKALLENPPVDFVVKPVYATRDEGYQYAGKFVSQFMGKTSNEIAEDGPIYWQRGDVFFGLDMQHHVQLARQDQLMMLRMDGVVVKFLVHDLLPIQLPGFFFDPGAQSLHESWLRMIAGFDGAICVSKATADSFREWIKDSVTFCSPRFHIEWVHNGADIESSRPSKGLPLEAESVLAILRSRSTFLTVSTLEARKGHQQLLEAIEALWKKGYDFNFVLVGREGWHVQALTERLRNHPESGRRLFWLDGISDEYLEHIYRTSSALVAASINEGFGLALIEAARHGLALIARDIPVFREVAGDFASYFSADSGEGLAEHLAQWFVKFRLGTHPKSKGLSWNTWSESTRLMKQALLEKSCPRQQLIVDISELVQRDARTGVQRVVRSVLREWLINPPDGYRVEPVYATSDEPYRYARAFTKELQGMDGSSTEDSFLEYAPGDIFFGLDMQPLVQFANRDFYQLLRRNGVIVKFLLHDLLTIQMPEHLPEGSEEGFTNWLKTITSTDGVVCVSRTVAYELDEWVRKNVSGRLRPFLISWSHNGADIDSSLPTAGMSKDASWVLESLTARPSFLMVGTLEPRKGHYDTLLIFERMWEQGHDINLVIVGKIGWKVEELAKYIEMHSQYKKRLFWLVGISDEYLNEIYNVCICLIAASYGEGFGLPLIEAAQREMPIIARDIPVFREVADKCATYFPRDMNTLSSADILELWLEDWRKGIQVSTKNLPWLSWRQSTLNLTQKIMTTK